MFNLPLKLNYIAPFLSEQQSSDIVMIHIFSSCAVCVRPCVGELI